MNKTQTSDSQKSNDVNAMEEKNKQEKEGEQEQKQEQNKEKQGQGQPEEKSSDKGHNPFIDQDGNEMSNGMKWKMYREEMKQRRKTLEIGESCSVPDFGQWHQQKTGIATEQNEAPFSFSKASSKSNHGGFSFGSSDNGVTSTNCRKESKGRRTKRRSRRRIRL